MLFVFPLAFAQELDPCRVHQLVQPCLAVCVRRLNIQLKLLPAQRAEVRYRPCKATQLKLRLQQARGLPGARPNRLLSVKQNWMAASESFGRRPRLPLLAANQDLRLSSQMYN
jgi:hypothetical protein